MNPYPYLNAAERLLFPGRLGETFARIRGARRRRRRHARASGDRDPLVARRQWTSVVGERPVTVTIGQGAAVDTSLAAALARARRGASSRGAPRRW